MFIGLFIGDIVFHDPLFHKKELTLMASRAALSKDFTRIIQLVEEGKLNPTSYITHRLNFSQVIDEFESLYQDKSSLIKAIIEL